MNDYKKDRKKVYRELLFLVKFTDLDTLHKLWYQIDKLSFENKDIPAPLINQLKSIVVSSLSLDIEENDSKIKNAMNKITAYLSNKKGFDFNGQSIHPPNFWFPFSRKPYKDKYKYTYTLMGLLHYCLHRYFEAIRQKNMLKEPHKLENDKKTAIKFFKSEIDMCSQVFNKQHKKAFSSRKKGAIAALLAESVEFTLANKKPQTIEEYYQASRR